MVRTSSTMLPLGSPLPSFHLEVVRTNLSQEGYPGLKAFTKSQVQDSPLLLMFLCAHCPFVKHVEPELTKIQRDYSGKIQILAISSNSLITHPEDGPESLAEQANNHGWSFPYLLDLDQSFAKSLKAACTPDFYLFSASEAKEQELRYRGQLDASRPGNKELLNGIDLRQALDAVLLGDLVPEDQHPSIGCNIKWNPGGEPSWFT